MKAYEMPDELGGIFTPVKGQRPVYTWGPKGNNQTREVMFQCPVSAIPSWVWNLLWLWWKCRLMRTLPVPGGFMDQPRMVQLAFPIFEAEMRQVEAGNREGGMAAAMTAALLKALHGGQQQ